jgi:hypothetical protein
MTKQDIINQLYDLSVAGYFNGEKFTKSRLDKYITNMLKTGNNLIMNISLPDGRWYFQIRRFPDNEYDYYIPDNREQEKKTIDKLFA